MTTTDLTPTPRELLAHAIATLRSRSQRPGTIAESIMWVGNADDNGQVPIAMLVGGTHIAAIQPRWIGAAAGHRDPTPAPGAAWWMADTETGRQLAATDTRNGYFAAASMEALLKGKTDMAEAIVPEKQRWILPETRDDDETRGRIETRAAQVAEGLDRCQHAMADERDIRYYLAGIAIGGTEGTPQAHLVSTDGQQLALHTLAITNTVRGFWGTNNLQNTEVVLPRRTIRTVTRALEASCKRDPCTRAIATRHPSSVVLRLENHTAIEIRTIDGSFPDWRRIMPSATRVHATKEVNSRDFVAAVHSNTAEAARRDCPDNGTKPSAEPTTKLRFYDDQIAIRCRPRHRARKGIEAYACTSVAARTTRATSDEFPEIRMVHEHLAKALGACARSGKRTQIEVSYSNTPIVLRSARTTMILMPDRWW